MTKEQIAELRAGIFTMITLIGFGAMGIYSWRTERIF